MRFTCLLIVIFTCLSCRGLQEEFPIISIADEGLKDGDLIFQTSLSNQSSAIQLATNSVYSHVGMLYTIGEQVFVLEAVEPVKLTAFDEWVARGKDGHYVVKRLKVEVSNDEVKSRMKTIGQNYLGKSYDLLFDWSDDKMYCSELIWKIYKRGANIELCSLEQFKDFDFSNALVQDKLKERYGDNLPYDMLFCSPKALFDSPMLKTVFTN